MRSVLCSIVATLLSTTPAIARPVAARPTEVMIVGLFHLSGSTHDLHNEVAPDVLQAKPQADIMRITKALARFHPDRIAVEWDGPFVEQTYAQYLAGTLKPSRNEVVQLGYRLGQLAGSKPVVGIDADGDFLWAPLKAYADEHGFSALMEREDQDITRRVAEIQQLIDSRGLIPALRRLNDPDRLDMANGWYRNLLVVGGDKQEPAVDLMAAWYRRNFQICANLIRAVKPGEHVVVFFGNGHAFLLRQCVRETPGMKLVEAADYLPR